MGLGIKELNYKLYSFDEDNWWSPKVSRWYFLHYRNLKWGRRSTNVRWWFSKFACYGKRIMSPLTFASSIRHQQTSQLNFIPDQLSAWFVVLVRCSWCTHFDALSSLCADKRWNNMAFFYTMNIQPSHLDYSWRTT